MYHSSSNFHGIIHTLIFELHYIYVLDKISMIRNSLFIHCFAYRIHQLKNKHKDKIHDEYSFKDTEHAEGGTITM